MSSIDKTNIQNIINQTLKKEKIGLSVKISRTRKTHYHYKSEGCYFP